MAMFSAVLDLLTLILLLVSPVVCLLIAFRSGPGRAVPRIGYFAFAVCAVLVALVAIV